MPHDRPQEGELIRGRELLAQAAATYERDLTPEEYWWLGVGLAACTLAELDEKEFAVSRIEQLMARLGYKGAGGDWFQRFLEELAALDAEGLLWPRFERSPDGPMEATGLPVHPSFDADAGYYLALAHLGVAVAVSQEDQERIAALANLIGELVEQGLQPSHREVILAGLT